MNGSKNVCLLLQSQYIYIFHIKFNLKKEKRYVLLNGSYIHGSSVIVYDSPLNDYYWTG